EPAIMVNGRWLPPSGTAIELACPSVALVGDQVAFAVVGKDQLADCSSHTIDDCLERWKERLPHHAAGGCLISYLWELIEHNSKQIELDCRHHFLNQRLQQAAVKIEHVGPADQVHIDPTAQLDPLVVADTTRGPVVIDAQAVIHAFSRLEGP